MAVRIRLARGGSKKRPFYKIVAADSRSPRDGKFIERLGSYNPLLPKDHAERLIVDQEKVKAWIGKGALPTERLEKLFSTLGLCAAPKFRDQPKKSAPKAKAVERIKEKDAKALEKAEAEKAAKEAEIEAKRAAKEAAKAAAAAPAPVEAEAPVAEEAAAEEPKAE